MPSELCINQSHYYCTPKLLRFRDDIDSHPVDPTTLVSFESTSNNLIEIAEELGVQNGAEWRVTNGAHSYFRDGTLCRERKHGALFVDVDWSQSQYLLQNFPQFKRLPTELRRQIWKYALPEPRAVTLAHEYRNGVLYLWAQSMFSQLELDLRYQLTCKEFREVFLENYSQLKFDAPIGRLWDDIAVADDQWRHVAERMSSRVRDPHGWVDLKRDTIFLDGLSWSVLEDHHVWINLSNARHLAVSETGISDDIASLWNLTQDCNKLRTMILLSGYGLLESNTLADRHTCNWYLSTSKWISMSLQMLVTNIEKSPRFWANPKPHFLSKSKSLSTLLRMIAGA